MAIVTICCYIMGLNRRPVPQTSLHNASFQVTIHPFSSRALEALALTGPVQLHAANGLTGANVQITLMSFLDSQGGKYDCHQASPPQREELI
jgi:hypothetical protein